MIIDGELNQYKVSCIPYGYHYAEVCLKIKRRFLFISWWSTVWTDGSSESRSVTLCYDALKMNKNEIINWFNYQVELYESAKRRGFK